MGRVLAGFLADAVLGPLNSLSLSLLLAGISALAIWPFANSVAVLSVFIVLNGLGCGAFFSLIPATVGSMFGAKNTMGVLPVLWAGWFFGYFFVSFFFPPPCSAFRAGISDTIDTGRLVWWRRMIEILMIPIHVTL